MVSKVNCWIKTKPRKHSLLAGGKQLVWESWDLEKVLRSSSAPPRSAGALPSALLTAACYYITVLINIALSPFPFPCISLQFSLQCLNCTLCIPAPFPHQASHSPLMVSTQNTNNIPHLLCHSLVLFTSSPHLSFHDTVPESELGYICILQELPHLNLWSSLCNNSVRLYVFSVYNFMFSTSLS